ncbi:o-succinylbenzoate synthase [Desulforamulus hydrothermalis]|uniref:o-succinylbenzoate synthase n=1 Tax=Desulforamulus hydrothermalis Lam5 = DSM 18033 TaxID=1121428 RepID=K8DXS8_9FIRM|nr:o-succinylbenzoate synthase [Desulforamulus hydrothermalis]CCO07537.1 o-succinylbenzoate synthase [Desulforamulus hydrothermalis Lam5 = DSM 18033]SHH30879.1 O-succinylbenzoate synthase [Desulforamulus hydrothermalis Lam5 = DSM 18033]
MKMHSITLRAMQMRLKAPFTTSFGTEWDKHFILVEVRDSEGRSGWGESVAMREPIYNEETVKTNWHMMKDFLIPLLWQRTPAHPQEVSTLFQHIRRNNMAKSALEGAVWDLYARQQGIPLSQALGGRRQTIEVGISIGIQESVDKLLALVEQYVEQGYRRIKIKIRPGWDIEAVAAVRNRFPRIPLMADANSAYTLADLERLRQLDQFDLMMVEQPLAHDDIVDHAVLQKHIKTPVCLDESIHSPEDARKAVELGSCRIINIKVGRVGGLAEARRIQEYCREQGIPVWCGGMLEAGVGRAHNVAVTTLPGFTLPGDTAASSRYWEQDIIQPEVTVEKGLIQVPDRPGIGYQPVREIIDRFTLYSETFRP